MPSATRRNKLQQVLQSLTEGDKERLRASMGVDVDTWTVDEAIVLAFARNVAEYRKVLAETLEPDTASPVPEGRPEFHCDFCGASGYGAELYVTVPNWKTICIECINLLVERARSGKV